MAIITGIKRQVLVAAGSLSKAVQPIPPTVPKEESFLHTAVPAAHMELSENAKTAFTTLSDAMKAECSIYDTNFWQVTESHEMEMRDSLLGKVDLILSDPPAILQSRAGEWNSKHDLFTWEDIRDLVEVGLEVMTLRAHEHIFCAWLKFGGWYQTLLGQREEVPSDKQLEGEQVVV